MMMTKDHDVIFGFSEAEERMRNETMDMAPAIRVDHNWYSKNPAALARKNKEVEDAKELSGYEIGTNGRMNKNKTDDNATKRAKFRMGGEAKFRKGYDF